MTDVRQEIIEWVEKAQQLLPGNRISWYRSVREQLEFVKSVTESGRRATAEELAGMSLSQLAMREFEPDFPDLALAIYEVMDRFRRL